MTNSGRFRFWVFQLAYLIFSLSFVWLMPAFRSARPHTFLQDFALQCNRGCYGVLYGSPPDFHGVVSRMARNQPCLLGMAYVLLCCLAKTAKSSEMKSQRCLRNMPGVETTVVARI